MVVESIQFAMSFISHKILYFLWWFVFFTAAVLKPFNFADP